jgi:hemerythrin-like domain-containing protein
MSWRSILESEHRVVLEVVDAAEKEAQRMEETGEARPDLLHDIVEFFVYFNDGLHDPKEEDLLFCHCHKRGMSCDEGVLGFLIADHHNCREYMDTLRASLQALRKGEGESPRDFGERLYAYAEFVRHHIEVEENEFFDVAEHYLTPEDSLDLSEEFESAHFDEIEEGVLEHFEALGHKLSRV